jgi:hypothetical protein
MNLAITMTLAVSGIFLLVGMIGGILKYRGIMKSPEHRASAYLDVAHRAALMYSFAALVMAELLRFSPYSERVQLVISGVPLLFFAISIGEYFILGLQNKITNQFATRNFNTTWGMLILIIGEVGGVGAIVWGFISTQLLT